MLNLAAFSNIFKHKLLKNASIYISSNVIRKAIPFFLLPVLTRYLSPSDYGIVATFQVLLAIMIVFIGLNMHGAVAVNFFKMDKQSLNIYIGNIFFILLVSFVSVLGIIYIFRNSFSQFLKFPKIWFPIITVVALSQSIFRIRITLWQFEQKPLPYGIFQIIQTIFNIGLSIIFVVAFNWQWQGRLLGIIITSIIFGVISFFLICIKKYFKFSFNKIYIKDILYFSIPLIPHALGGWIITGIDRIFINSMVNVAATGIYTVGYQIGMIIGFFATSFNQAWSPYLFEKLKEDKYSTKIKIVKITYLYDIAIIILALTLSFIAPYLLRFFVGKSFHSANKYVIWIALGYAAEGMYYMVVNYIFYVRKTYILAWVTFFSACVNISLNYILIKAYGAIGAAQATTISFFLTFFLVWVLSARVYHMPWFSLLKKIDNNGRG